MHEINNNINEITPLSDCDCFYIVERYKSEFTYPLHSHLEFELNFVERGAGVQRIVGDSVEVIDNYDLVLITGKELTHAWKQHECREKNIREVTIQFSADLFSDSLLNKNQFESIRKMLDSAQVGLVFPIKTIMKVYAQLDSLAAKQGFDAFLSFMSILYQLSLSPAVELSSSSFAQISSPTDSRRVQKVYEYIKHNFASEITLSQLSELTGMTPTAFSRFFTQRTGKRLSDYIIDVRMGNVTRLLVNSTNSISEICMECGFNNISNFNRIFKKKKGCSPKEFRDNYRKIRKLI